jgi:hypothetical protein
LNGRIRFGAFASAHSIQRIAGAQEQPWSAATQPGNGWPNRITIHAKELGETGFRRAVPAPQRAAETLAEALIANEDLA